MGKPEAPETGGSRLPFLPTLDGIRALAVLAVFFYHADLEWMPGGFLGVEVFFVLSGYLITAIIWTSIRSEGRLSLKRFWVRRARRLLPAVLALLTGVTVASLIGWPEEVGRIRGDVVAALGYVSNCYQLGTDQGYFSAAGRPSPFRHLWSLAIEEQFYLVWPPVLAFLAFTVKRPGRIAGIVVAFIAGSTALLWLFANADAPSRGYYGTDARAAGLLMGAALALIWRPWELSTEARLRVSGWVRPLEKLGFLALAFILVTFVTFSEFSTFTFGPGITLVALATTLLIAATVHPGERATSFLGWSVLTALGRRSYAIYLWHWPVFVVTRPGVDLELSTSQALIVRSIITFILADISYRYIEMPIRSGALGRIGNRIRRRAQRSSMDARRLAFGWVTIALAFVVAMGSVAGAVVGAPGPRPTDVERSLDELEIDGRPAKPVAIEAAIEIPPPFRPAGSGSRFIIPALPAIVPSARPGTDLGDVMLVGDSVMLGAGSIIPRHIDDPYINARVSRAVHDGLDFLKRLRQRDRLGETVVIHLGNNGMFTDDQFDQLMHVLRGVERIVVVNVKVPRRWEGPVNRTIARGVQRYPTVGLVDWHRAWRSCPGKVFASDGYHLTKRGARCYSDLIATAIA